MKSENFENGSNSFSEVSSRGKLGRVIIGLDLPFLELGEIALGKMKFSFSTLIDGISVQNNLESRN